MREPEHDPQLVCLLIVLAFAILLALGVAKLESSCQAPVARGDLIDEMAPIAHDSGDSHTRTTTIVGGP